MTREEAIKVLNMVEAHGIADEAKRMAIEALSAPSGDLISRADAIEAVVNAHPMAEVEKGSSKQVFWVRVSDVAKALKALPSADVEPIVYCMDCAKSVPLDEHGALWKCNAHDRTTLRHSYCSHGERKGGDSE